MMFVPESMRKLNIFVHEEDIEQVAVALARLETLDLTETQERDGWSGPREDWAERADTYANQTHRAESLLEILEIDRQKVPPQETLEPGQDTAHLAERLEEAELVVQDWRKHKQEVENRIEQLDLLRQAMSMLEPLAISVEEIRDFKYLYLVLGTVPKESLENLQIVLFRIPFVIVPVQEHDDRVLIFAATDQAHGAILERAMRSVFMEPLELPQSLIGASVQIVAELEERLEVARGQQSELEQERRQLVEEWRTPLLGLWRQASSNAAVTNIINRLDRHNDIYLVSGWVPAKALDEVVAAIKEVTEGRADVEVLEPVFGEQSQRVPTLLRNPAFIAPFEVLVSTFGFPAYDEIDPTPLAALTFVLMYGMMFGDVGHGLMLALVGLWLWRGRSGTAASGDTVDPVSAVGAVVAVSGFSAMLFGFLYGSLFGREDILPHLWLSPLHSIADILIVSILAGVVLLNIGFLLHLIVAWRARDWGKLLFTPNGLAGIWFYWALLAGAFVLWQGISLPFTLWLLLTLIPAGLIFLHQPLARLIRRERPAPEQSWGEYSIQSFFELFETLIRNISNSLSFVRLGAFAVAHAGLSQVVFSLANLTGGGWQWLVILVGTLLIVGFEGLIVGIQALRLEYYEIFGKFFGGQGRAFTPLRLSKEVEQV